MKFDSNNGITEYGLLGLFPVTPRYFDGLLDVFQKDLEAHLVRSDSRKTETTVSKVDSVQLSYGYRYRFKHDNFKDNLGALLAALKDPTKRDKFTSRLRYIGFLDNGIGFTVQTDLKNMLLDIMLDDEKILIRLRKIDNKESSIDYKEPPIANIKQPKTKLNWIEIGGIAAYIILALAYLGISFLEWI